MLKVVLTNKILKQISAIDGNRFSVESIKLPQMTQDKLREKAKRRSSYASNRIEGNPLTESQANEAMEMDDSNHLLTPERDMQNYYLALNLLEEKRMKHTPFSKNLLLEVQALVEKGAPDKKIGLRGATPPGVLFAVYDSVSGSPEYIPPEYSDIPVLLDELTDYVNTTDDHPLIVAAVVHYQLVTIHPFEDGNGRTARLMSGYILDSNGYHFNGIGSLEEYFAYDPDEYYASLQMGLPARYDSGRDNPPHPEIWIHYFLHMVELYSGKLCELSKASTEDVLDHLNTKEKAFLAFLLQNHRIEFTPIAVSKELGVTNRTIINRCAKLVAHNFLVPHLVKERVRSYSLNEFARQNQEYILQRIFNK